MSPRGVAGVGAVVFDFDGVLVESNAIKRAAYFEIFRGDSAAQALIEPVLKDHPSADRYGLIAAILRRLGQTPSSEDVEKYALRYGQICEDNVSVCPEVPGATAVIAHIGSWAPIYINSDTPQDSLRRVVRRRGWESWFKAVLGRPRSKRENLASVLQAEGLSPRQVLFVGDRRGDWEAAIEHGVQFIGRLSDASDFKSGDEPSCVRDMAELVQRLAATRSQG